ncbi:MAG: dihydroorotase [Bacteroidales bacterium]|nr:dihydroorotase [Bacteroidales bacterium]
MNYLLYNAFVVNEGKYFKGGLCLKDGIIESVFEEKGETAEREMPCAAGYSPIDLQGACILPGVIDSHVHFRQPGLTHKGDIASESAAALRGGVTSFMDMPNTQPQTLSQRLLAEKYEAAAGTSLVNYSFYMGCSEDNMEEVLKTDPRSVCGIKLFLGSSTGNMLVRNPRYIDLLFREAPTLIAAHCEDEATITENMTEYKEKYGENAPFDVHALIRSREACFRASSFATELARKHQTRFHLLHISTEKELELLDHELISGEICCNYLWFSQEDYKKKTWRIKCNPAIKTPHDRASLQQAVKTGKFTVSTDHAPHTLEEKQKPYFSCPSGAPGIQHSLPMMLELVHQKVFTLPQAVQAMCHRPAQLYRIERRGFLREGYAADLAIVKPDEPWTVERSDIAYKCGWSPLEGERLHGKVWMTFVNGNLVYGDGRIVLPGYRGERLRFL